MIQHTSTTVQLENKYITLDGTALMIPEAAHVIIIGNDNTTIDAAQLSRVFHVHGHLQLERVRLTGGRANSGAGLKAEPGSMIVLNGVLVDNCNARRAGGALAAFGASVTLEACHIFNCSVNGAYAPSHGGALYAEDALKRGHQVLSHVLIRSSTITDCSVEGSTLKESEVACDGGALCFTGGSSVTSDRAGPTIENTTITRCTIVARQGRAAGAGLSCRNLAPTVRNSTIELCSAVSRRGDTYGGAVHVLDGGLTMTGSMLAHCSAVCLESEWYSYAFGGGLYLVASGSDSLTLEDSQILGCSCSVQASNGQVRAAGMLLTHSARTTVDKNTMTVKRCIIAECTAIHQGSGSAIAAAVSFLYVACLLEDVKIQGCTAMGISVYGGAMYASSATLTFRRCEVNSCAAIARGATGTAFGGGLLLYGSAAFEDSSFFNCSATSSTGNAIGGAIDVRRCHSHPALLDVHHK